MSTDNLDQLIKHYRQSWSLTQGQFAERFGLDARSVRRWESGAVKPRKKNLQKLAPCLKAREDAMDRRNFFRYALTMSWMFAAPYQQPDLQRLTELLLPERTPLSIGEELRIIETLTKICWQMLPHWTNMVDSHHLEYVRHYRQRLESWLKSAPDLPVDPRLTSAVSEVAQVEGGLLYALKRPEEAERAYQAAIKIAHESGNVLVEAIGLTWFGNFLIDTGQADKAVAKVEVARKNAEKGGASLLVRAWIAATEADAWANQREAPRAIYKCEVALDRATEWTRSVGSEPENSCVPYDRPWLFGYRGTVYAHLGRPQDVRQAQSELKQGLASLGLASTYRRWGYYKDLIIASSLDQNVEEACHYARLAMNVAEQTNAPMFLQRAQDTTQQSLKRWKDSSIMKDLMEEFRVAQQKLALAKGSLH